MLAVVGAAAVVLLAGAPWVLPSAAGGENLKPPENIDIYIIDDNYTLKWSSHRESMGNVTFSAEYQVEEVAEWIKVPECQHIPRTNCEFSLKVSAYDDIKFRLRAEEGNSTSSWKETDPFIPVYKAHMSPPGVHLEAEDKAILVHISPPGQGGSMWAQENFSYMILIWQKSSSVKNITKPTYYPVKISKLLPETTYCLEVKAIHQSQKNPINSSAVQCIRTTVANKLPVPENLEVDAKGKSYVLKWDYASPNMSFKAQWIPGYLKSSSRSHSDTWKPIPTCTNVWTMHCAFSRATVHTGTFFLRVQASDGNNTSFWSEEKYIASQNYTLLPPPAIAVTPTRDTLLVRVSVDKCDGVTYEIIFRENTSNTERRMMQEHPEFTLGTLQPLTVYCVQAKVVCRGLQTKMSKFSDELCKKTRPGHSSRIWIIIAFVGVFFSVMALYAGRSLQKYLHYVFFPPLKPPPSIDEFFSEPPSKTLLLLTAEEHTERCFIIEHTDTVAGGEHHAPEEDLRKYSSQTSQDSGNYSNEDEESVGTESGQAVLSTAPCGRPCSEAWPHGTLGDGTCFLGNEMHLQTPS
ncbi:interferon alpha/beta receptor 1 isoform X1 [Arvicanthis niloticus]|uniref:interferon alpha/beta receptor 1 isoform X1 n=1 Tax=Arvicanthis niloticus TaxID=61156 RepID=UPI0014864195|nr:interferon alpha/beta receptor 1 isoform X1 [Arvicanthis niloticus]